MEQTAKRDPFWKSSFFRVRSLVLGSFSHGFRQNFSPTCRNSCICFTVLGGLKNHVHTILLAEVFDFFWGENSWSLKLSWEKNTIPLAILRSHRTFQEYIRCPNQKDCFLYVSRIFSNECAWLVVYPAWAL